MDLDWCNLCGQKAPCDGSHTVWDIPCGTVEALRLRTILQAESIMRARYFRCGVRLRSIEGGAWREQHNRSMEGSLYA